MEPLYHETNKLIIETQQLFPQLESSKSNSYEIENEIQNKIETVQRNCEKLDTYIYKVPIAQRQTAKMRNDQLKYDNRHLQAGLKSWQYKKQKQLMEDQEREQLLNRRFEPNADTLINIDYSLQHNTSLQNANRGVDEMLLTGSSVLDSLRSQRGTLKGARRKILDMANTLGLSNYTMRLIEKRASQDKILLIAGMVFTCFVIGVVVIYIA